VRQLVHSCEARLTALAAAENFPAEQGAGAGPTSGCPHPRPARLLFYSRVLLLPLFSCLPLNLVCAFLRTSPELFPLRELLLELLLELALLFSFHDIPLRPLLWAACFFLFLSKRKIIAISSCRAVQPSAAGLSATTAAASRLAALPPNFPT
jgi:hypothetical protein